MYVYLWQALSALDVCWTHSFHIVVCKDYGKACGVATLADEAKLLVVSTVIDKWADIFELFVFCLKLDWSLD